MPQRTRPPFRAEHVGSLPRPDWLMDARDQFASGQIDKERLQQVEHKAVHEAVAMQERAGIGAITDGEYRKRGWREFLFEKVEGFGGEFPGQSFPFTNFDGTQWTPKGERKCVAKLRRRQPITADDFSWLKLETNKPVKANLPTPSIAHAMAGDASFDSRVYGSRDEYLAALAAIYREEIADLGKRGCTYLQLDEVPLAIICDPRNQEIVRMRGEDPKALIDAYINVINDCLQGRPKDMTVAVHMCRGNVGHGMASGGYEPIAERMFNTLEVDGFFLEFDTPRAGDFSPLRFMPKGRIAVLGLVSSKLPELESGDALKRRIDEAARYCSIEQLALSPQCGFSSAARRGHCLSMAQVEAKLARIVEVAERVWG